MFGNFTEEARGILVRAKEEMYALKHPYVGSEHLLLAILKSDNPISRKLKQYHLDYKKLKEEIIRIVGVGSKESNWFLYTPLLKRVMENAVIDAKENNHGEVTISHLFASLLEEGEGVAIRIMVGLEIDLDELYSEFSYHFSSSHKTREGDKLLLEELGVDLTKKARDGQLDPVIGREKEMKRVIEILMRRTKNNPLLIGDAGVGKTAIVEELSRMIAFGEVPPMLKNKRIISLDMATTVAGTKYRGEFEDRMRKILKEIEDHDDIILFIDEIHTLVGAGGAEGAIDASNIFKPALARGKLRCIGATTTAEYKTHIETDSALERRFQKVNIEVPTKETVKEILTTLKPIYEKYHFVSISDEMIDLIIRLSDTYIYDRNQPDKAIDIMDEVCARVSLKESKELKQYNEYNKKLQAVRKQKNEAIMNDDFKLASHFKDEENKWMNELNELELKLYQKSHVKNVTKEDIASVVHMKTSIPVYELLQDNKMVIEKIEEDLKERIMGQDQAVSEVIKIAKRIKLGYQDENRCYSYLFCGPSGVGKTELSKVFAKHLVGENNVIKLDMSEFSEAHTVSKIVGAPPGYVGYMDHRNILDEIKNKPYSVLILDEIEKAHPSILNLFLQILDEGKIKDSKGSIIRFDHVTIVMTSNIGFHDINIGFTEYKESNVITKLKEFFSVPFINRIDQVIVFKKLGVETIRKLVEEKLKKVVDKYQSKNINVRVDDNVIEEMIVEANYQEFGARKLNKIILDYIENQIIEALLNNKKECHIRALKTTSIPS